MEIYVLKMRSNNTEEDFPKVIAKYIDKIKIILQWAKFS